jgi:LPXTG-motif cell wall-anchored protein
MVRLLLLTLLLLPRFVFAQTIEAEALTDSSSYLVGDYITLKVELKYDKGIKVFFPSVVDSIKSLEFISQKPTVKEESDGKILEIHTLVFSKYDSGSVTIPAIPIKYSVGADTVKSIIKTRPFKIEIQTIQVDPRGKIQDVKPPVKIPFPWWWILLILLGIILLGGAAYWFWKKKKHGEEETRIVKKIVVPPDKLALQRLYELEEKKLWQQGKIKQYHTELTEIIRKYFEERFHILAMESTSNEIIEKLKTIREAESILDVVREFFENADLVKFAKFEPMPSVNEAMMKQAYEIVRKTRLEREEASAEEGNDV